MTKENYEDAIMRMYNFCISSNHPVQIREQFSQDLDFLAKLAEEHFEEKQETNLEHYKDEIKYAGYEFALVNGKPTTCKLTLCDQCYFNDKHFTCTRKRMEWMLKLHKKSVYKLTRFEYDLLQNYKGILRFKNMNTLNWMKGKGYFKGIDENETVGNILANCEVINDGNC